MPLKIHKYNAYGPYTLSTIAESDIPVFPGVFVILGDIEGTDNWKVLDVGQTKNLRQRFSYNDERVQSWKKQGFNNIGVGVIFQKNYKSRLRMEKDLRDHFDPPCGWEKKSPTQTSE